jgi:hypothetical protein
MRTIRSVMKNVVIGSSCAITSVCIYDFYSKTKSESHSFQSAVYQYMLHKAMRLFGHFARQRLDSDSMVAEKVQEELLLELLRKNKNTKLGLDFKFDEIRSVQEYRERIPLTTYPFYSQYINEIKLGKQNVMTAEPVHLLGATSGTSGQKSLLPHVAAIQTTFFTSGIALIFDTIFSKAFPEADQLQKTTKLTFLPRWQYTEGTNTDEPNETSNATSNAAHFLIE